MLDEELAIGLKKRKHLVGERIDGFVGDQAVGGFAPSECGGHREDEDSQREGDGSLKPTAH